MSWGKFFASTFTGSMAGAGANVFAVWGYCLANGHGGQVDLNPVVVSALLGASVKDVNDAIEYLCSPDPKSRSSKHDGRRLVPLVGVVYEIVNYPGYHGVATEESRREYNRLKQAESRARRAVKLDSQTTSSPLSSLLVSSDLSQEGDARGPETLRLAKGLASSSDPAQSLETTLAPGKDLPESSTGIPTVIREIPDGFTLPEDIRQDARILGLSDTEIDHYWGELCKGPIGGTRGILQKRFAKYLKDLPKQWRVWAEVARSSNTIGRSGAFKGRYGSSPVWEPKSSHVAFCAKYGISPERMAEMARDYVNSGEPEQRGGKKDADDAFMNRLKAEVTKRRKAAG